MATSLSQLMANNTPQSWTRGAARSIFDLFAGHEPAKQAGYTQGLRLASLLEGARRKRDENLGFSQITPDLVTQALGGDKQAAATLASAAAHGGVPIRQFSQYGLDQDRLRALAHLKDAFAGIGYTAPQADLSSALIGANGGQNINNDVLGATRAQVPLAGTAAVPQDESALLHAMGLDTTGQSGGVLYDKFAAPGAQTAVATPVGAAQAKADIASAAQRNAHARVYGAQADAGGFNPNVGTHGHVFWPNESTLKALMTKPASEANGYKAAVNTQALRETLAWHAAHPTASWEDFLQSGPADVPGTRGYAATAPRVGVSSFDALGETKPEGFDAAVANVPVVHVSATGAEAPPAAAAPAPAAPRIAVNPQTGAKVVWNGSAWVPYDG